MVGLVSKSARISCPPLSRPSRTSGPGLSHTNILWGFSPKFQFKNHHTNYQYGPVNQTLFPRGGVYRLEIISAPSGAYNLQSINATRGKRVWFTRLLPIDVICSNHDSSQINYTPGACPLEFIAKHVMPSRDLQSYDVMSGYYSVTASNCVMAFHVD